MKSRNPAMSGFSRIEPMANEERMTVEGAVNKSVFLIALVFFAAAGVWYIAGTPQGALQLLPLMWPSLIAGFVLCLIISFAPKTSPYLAPLYALTEGVFLGILSLYINTVYPGIAIQAVMLTFGDLLLMLVLYKTKVIQPTERFRSILMTALFALVFTYIGAMLLRLAGVAVPYIHQGGAIGIGISVAIVVLASLFLILDFEMIEENSALGAPKYMEWFAGFSLLVTLVWIYVEMLRLLTLLTGRD